MRCAWTGCRRKATYKATWRDGTEGAYCTKHAVGVSWTHEPDVLPDLDDQQRAGVMAAVAEFKSKSQKLVDKSDGMTRISVSFGDGPSITVAEKKP